MDLHPLRALAAEWRDAAEMLRANGAPGPATAVERCAAQLEERLGEWWTEPLGVEEAADELGLSYDAARKRIARGTYPNAGSPGAPRVRRCDLHGSGGPEDVRGGGVGAVLDSVLDRAGRPR